jgi:hypothetical protein
MSLKILAPDRFAIRMDSRQEGLLRNQEGLLSGQLGTAGPTTTIHRGRR